MKIKNKQLGGSFKNILLIGGLILMTPLIFKIGLELGLLLKNFLC
ncbi:MAG: hypothetical protein RSA48_01655 [Bacilli bacterium]